MTVGPTAPRGHIRHLSPISTRHKQEKWREATKVKSEIDVLTFSAVGHGAAGKLAMRDDSSVQDTNKRGGGRRRRSKVKSTYSRFQAVDHGTAGKLAMRDEGLEGLENLELDVDTL